MDAWKHQQSPRLFDLQTERLNRGLSRKGLARAAGVNRETIRRLETGRPGIQPENAKLIADFFGITVVEFLDSLIRDQNAA